MIAERVQIANPLNPYHGKAGIVTDKGVCLPGIDTVFRVQIDGETVEQEFFASDLQRRDVTLNDVERKYD